MSVKAQIWHIHEKASRFKHGKSVRKSMDIAMGLCKRMWGEGKKRARELKFWIRDQWQQQQYWAPEGSLVEKKVFGKSSVAPYLPFPHIRLPLQREKIHLPLNWRHAKLKRSNVVVKYSWRRRGEALAKKSHSGFYSVHAWWGLTTFYPQSNLHSQSIFAPSLFSFWHRKFLLMFRLTVARICFAT